MLVGLVHREATCVTLPMTVETTAMKVTVLVLEVHTIRIDTRYTLLVSALKLETEAVVCNETPLSHKKLV